MHATTRIAGLANGGLLCAGPDGVRIFNRDGNTLLREEGQQYRNMSRPQVRVLATGSWEACPLAQLIPIARIGSLEAISTQQKDMEGKIYNFFNSLNECLTVRRSVREGLRQCDVLYVSSRVECGALLREVMNEDLALVL